MKIGTKSTIAMKKNFYIITAAALSLVACSRNQEVDIPDANLSIFAKTESPADTKTVVESGVHVFWEPGDEIAVFTGEQSAKFTTDITAASGRPHSRGLSEMLHGRRIWIFGQCILSPRMQFSMGRRSRLPYPLNKSPGKVRLGKT